MYMQYNTPAYRKHYKMLVTRYDGFDKDDVCEPRVRLLCQIIRESGLGVSVFSCEGHANETPPYAGYVMLAARNRDSATKLIDVLQQAMADAIKYFSIGGIGEIETNVACWQTEDDLYPSIVLRNPSTEYVELADKWWDLITMAVHRQLKHHITANPENKVLV